jgi:hypothetical protein
MRISRPGSPDIGLINDYGIGQSEFLWYIRGNRNVKKIFSSIWNSDELFTSFDGAGCYRNWHINEEWKTMGGWYHCDQVNNQKHFFSLFDKLTLFFQNPFKKPDRCSIQGFVALTDNNPSTGGLVLVPYSHKNFINLQFVNVEEQVWGDFITIPPELTEHINPCLIQCKAGDLVLWDSRTFHCNTPALIDQQDDTTTNLLRLVAYICMSPLSLFVPDGVRYENLEEFRELREDFVRDRVTCSHWPLELITASMFIPFEYMLTRRIILFQVEHLVRI